MKIVSAAKPSLYQPSDYVLLDEINITHINDRQLSEPVAASVVLRVRSTLQCRIESDCFPKDLINFQSDPFFIRIASDFEVDVMLGGYDSDTFLSSADIFTAYLMPCFSPCSVVDRSVDIRSVSFGILNFPTFYGKADKWVAHNGNNHRLGFIETEIDGFRVKLEKIPISQECRDILNEEDGFAVTHSGLLERRDGKSFSVGDAEKLLRAIRVFLSFARGAACGLTLVKATKSNGDEAVLMWGTSHTEPWSHGNNSWMTEIQGGDALSQIFPRFLDSYGSSEWEKTIVPIVDWYTNGNGAPFHIGIILAQSALESLAYRILGNANMSARNRLLTMLKKFDIDPAIPKSCNNLKKWLCSRQVKGEKDGPTAITKIRNELIHSKKGNDQIPPRAQMEACDLALWYVEIVLLLKFGYEGPYRN